jgi:hypothetical protein
VNRDEYVECYACYNRLSQEHLNPTLVRTIRKIFRMMRERFDPEPDVCPTAAFAPEDLTWAKSRAPCILRPSSASWLDRRGRARDRQDLVLAFVCVPESAHCTVGLLT